MNQTSSMISNTWGKWPLIFYILGPVLYVVFGDLDALVAGPIRQGPTNWYYLAALGPLVSFTAVALSDLSNIRTILWALFVPIVTILVMLVRIIIGVVLLDEPLLVFD